MTDAQQALWTATYAAALNALMVSLDSPSPDNNSLLAMSVTARHAANMALNQLHAARETGEPF